MMAGLYFYQHYQHVEKIWDKAVIGI